MKFLTLLCILLPFLYLSPANAAKNSQLQQYTFNSKTLQNSRDIWIYTPPHYSRQTDKPLPLLIVFDGQAYISSLVPTPRILDTLISQGKIRPLIAVFVSSKEQIDRNKELPCNAQFNQFLTDELLPWVSARFPVGPVPNEIAVCGSSYGGLAALYSVWKRPDIFGKALSQSGSFAWGAQNSPESEALIHLVTASPVKNRTLYLNVGLEESQPYLGRKSTLQVNREMRDLLVKNGNVVYYEEYPGGHEYEWWSKTIPSGLMVLFPIK